MTTTFTKQQLADWKVYERVRQSGRWNMFDPRARRETGLSGERYSFVLQNYSELKEALERKSTIAQESFTPPEGKEDGTAAR